MKNLFKAGWIVLLIGAVMTAIGVAKDGAKSIEFKGIKPVELKEDKKITKKYDVKEAKNLVMALNKEADGSNSDYSSIVNVEVRQGDAFFCQIQRIKGLGARNQK